jgi:hypothetical protein
LTWFLHSALLLPLAPLLLRVFPLGREGQGGFRLGPELGLAAGLGLLTGLAKAFYFAFFHLGLKAVAMPDEVAICRTMAGLRSADIELVWRQPGSLLPASPARRGSPRARRGLPG